MSRREWTDLTHEYYNLLSVLYQAVEGVATCEVYIQGAEEAGDCELAQFFHELQAEESRRAERVKNILVKRMGEPAIH